MSERERFETWALASGAYESLYTTDGEKLTGAVEFNDMAWLAWQAALADRPEQPVALLNDESFIDDYLADYALEGDDGCYTPTETERFMLKDAIMGLVAILPDAPPSHPAPSEAGAERQWTTVAMVDDQPITTMPERCLKWPCIGEGSMATLRPVRAPHGKWYMQCPLCDGSYGEVAQPAKGDAS